MTPQDLTELDNAVSACMKCGFCKAACPLFLGEETTTPRAKVRLARAVARGEMELTGGIRRQMDRCLNCRSCAGECPSGVEPNRVALAMREAFVDRDGLPLLKQLIFRSGLPHPRLMAWGSKVAGLAEHVSGIEMQNNPLRHLLPLVGLRKDKDLPILGRRTLIARMPEVMEAIGTRKTTVVYFPGCATNLLYPDTGIAVISVLRKLGARVVLPRDLVCCSTPVFNSGDTEGARRLAGRNIEILSAIHADHIITACGSCGLTIGQEWTEVLGLSEAALLGGKVMDISDFVAEHAPDGALQPAGEFGTVTYHDSCHLKRGMGVHESPRQLLRAILGARFVEMEHADRCCGGGGAFSLYHPELSQTVAEVKMRCLDESGAEAVATGCPACIIQLRDSLVHRRMPQKTIHTVEIIDRALR